MGGVGGGVFDLRDPEEENTNTNTLSLTGNARAPAQAPERTPAPAREDDTPTEVVTPVDRYRTAYERGISGAIGRPFAMPRKTEGYLHQAIQAFSEKRRGPKLDAWIEKSASEFAKYVSSLPTDEQRFWSDRNPTGFLRWLNKGSPIANTSSRLNENPNPVFRPERMTREKLEAELVARAKWEREQAAKRESAPAAPAPAPVGTPVNGATQLLAMLNAAPERGLQRAFGNGTGQPTNATAKVALDPIPLESELAKSRDEQLAQLQSWADANGLTATPKPEGENA